MGDVHEGSDCACTDADGYGLAEADLGEGWVVRLRVWVRDCACREVVLWHVGELLMCLNVAR